MSGSGYLTKAKKAAASLPILLAVGITTPAHADTAMTAGVVAREMSAKEFFAYVYGIVDGLAYARFRKDSAEAGRKVETGMNCIYGWFFPGSGSSITSVKAAFEAHPDHIPPVVIAAMIKKECGE